MNIYTASSFYRYRDVREFNKQLRELGHTITHDWTLGGEFDEGGEPKSLPTEIARKRYALKDFLGVERADLVIFLDDERANGGRWECGMQAGKRKPVWIIGPVRRRVIFDALPWVETLDSKAEALRLLRLLQTSA